MIKMGSFDTDYFIDLEYMKVFCHSCQAVITAELADHGKPIQCHSCSEYMIVPKNRFAPSVVINDFVLHDEIGAGGCGTVFLAYQISLDRYCALKILHNRTLSEDKYLHELMQEGRVAGRLNHPNIVQCYSIGEEEGIYFYAMEYVDGKSLKEVLTEKYKLSPGRSIDITIQVLNALSYSWDKQRLVHRDVKPDNIMINIEGEVKLTDMGLALPAHAIRPTDGDFIIGSPQYISPEQIMDLPQDFRSDIYSLGAVLYKMLTGQFIFKASNAEEICQMHVDDKPVSPAVYTPELPDELCEIVLKMLEKSPDGRYPDYESLKSDLLRVRDACNTNTSQEITTKAELPPLPAKPEPKTKSSLFHWFLSLSALGIFTFISYQFVIKPKLTARPADSLLPQTAVESLNAPQETVIETLPETKPAKSKLAIAAIMPDPQGYDAGNEWIEISNTGDAVANLSSWTITDLEGKTFQLVGIIQPGKKKRFTLPETSVTLNNGGDTIKLVSKTGQVVSKISYSEKDILTDQPLLTPDAPITP